MNQRTPFPSVAVSICTCMGEENIEPHLRLAPQQRQGRFYARSNTLYAHWTFWWSVSTLYPTSFWLLNVWIVAPSPSERYQSTETRTYPYQVTHFCDILVHLDCTDEKVLLLRGWTVLCQLVYNEFVVFNKAM